MTHKESRKQHLKQKRKSEEKKNNMIKVNAYTVKGEKSGKTDLPYEVKKVNLDLLAQAMRVYEDKTHPGTSMVKTRGMQTRSTKKIYRQKGTGGARHGARSAPIFVGGGVAHGPKGVKRILTLPKKLRQKALLSALLLKSERNEVIVVSKLGDIKKTKQASELLKKISSNMDGVESFDGFLFAFSKANNKVTQFLRNLEKVSFTPFVNLNARHVLTARVLILDKEALDEQEKKEKTEKDSGKARSHASNPKAVKVKSVAKNRKQNLRQSL
jgi:large subunit ribosomal protein L4